MSNEPFLIKMQPVSFMRSVTRDGGSVVGKVTHGEHTGKEAIVRLLPEAYSELLRRPEIAPHIQKWTRNEHVPMPDPKRPGSIVVALKPIFEYPAGGGPATKEEMLAKLGEVSVVIRQDRPLGMPGMPRDHNKIVGDAVGSLIFKDSGEPTSSGGPPEFSPN